MRYRYIIFLGLILSCSKNTDKKEQKSVEDQCFQTLGINYDEKKSVASIPTSEEILRNLPKQIQYSENASLPAFSFDKDKYQENLAKERDYFVSESYKAKFSGWISLLPEFNYLSEQKFQETSYALAKNKYGLWLVEKTADGKAKPYFLGLTQNVFTKIPENQNFEFIKNGNIVLNGSLLVIERLSKYPIIPKYTVIKDRQQFSLNLDAVKKDSDQDGFNDFFEDFIGLNPDSKDTDNDGTDDFNDLNPRFKSDDSNLAKMYEAIADVDGNQSRYTFTEVLTDCSNFQKISPKNQKFLFYGTSEKFKLKDDVLNLYFPVKYSKIQKPKNKLQYETYFMDFGDEKGDGNLSAELIDGKWKVTRQYNLKFGM